MSSEDPADAGGSQTVGRSHYISTAEEKEERSNPDHSSNAPHVPNQTSSSPRQLSLPTNPALSAPSSASNTRPNTARQLYPTTVVSASPRASPYASSHVPPVSPTAVAATQSPSSPSVANTRMLLANGTSQSEDADTMKDVVTLASPSAAGPPPSYEDATADASVRKQQSTGLAPPATNTAAAKYLQLQHKLREHWKDCPDVYIHYNNLHYTLRVPIVEISTPSFLRAGAALLFRLVKTLDVTGYLKKNDRTLDLHALASCNGRIAPGQMTLVLAPPGHGKSIYLKALAGRLNRDSKLEGAITYNGLTAAQIRKRGVVLSKLAMYVAQTDMHFPTLTVKETLAFAAENSCASTEPFGDAALDQMEKERAERLIHLIGLEEATNTIIGNDLLRGVSGGQRKRVTLGEMLITNSRVYFLDEVSTGLDSAITFHIFNALRSYCHECRNSVVTALLQPTPETYGLFDEIVLLRDGEVVYHGLREGVKVFFRDILGFPIPEDEDEAGFVVDYLTNPTLLRESQRRKRERAQKMAEYAQEREVSRNGKHRYSEEKQMYDKQHAASVTQAEDSCTEHSIVKPTYDHTSTMGGYSVSKVSPALETADMVQRYRQSTYYTQLMMEADAARQLVQTDSRYSLDPSRWSDFSKRQYAQPFPHSWPRHFHMAVTRQGKLFWRNKQVLMPRIFQAVLMGIVYGTLFYKLAIGDYQSKMGLLMYLTMFGAFANLSELPVAAEARAVVTKQLDSSFYPTLPYIFSVIFLSLPLLVIETLIFGTLMYWLPGFVPEAGRYFFWLLLLLCGSLAMSTFFRTISYVTPNPDVARQLDFPFILLFVIFGGFLIPYSEIPHWLVWVFWISPLSWGVRSLALNEFKSSRYDGPSSSGQRLGDFYMSTYDVFTNEQYKWAGVGYLLGFFLTWYTSTLTLSLQPRSMCRVDTLSVRRSFLSLLCVSRRAVVSSYAITYIRAGGSLGTKRLPPVDNKQLKAQGLHVADGGMVDTNGKPVEAAVTDTTATALGSAATTVASEVGAPMGAAISVTNSAAARNPIAVTPQVGGHVSLPIAVQPRLPSRHKSSFQLSGMPFTPVTLTWRNIHYYVDVGGRKNKVTKHLLKGINGFSKPGTLTALMGSSGAGKTTLMDVVAGRKTMGKITGDILVNGRPKETTSFNNLTGYVEQMDLHMGLHTIREALDFSAKIRLPASVSKKQRDEWVEEVMQLVGLARIGHRIIGDAATPGLSPGQMKLVTIAVELVANPSVLFLDEPTSGLDAPSAFRIMKAVSRIAQTGRSVLCTIHQPSAELFFMFDKLLLLRSGGEEVFFGDIGPHAALLVVYFENASISKHPPRLPPGQNPANWMLDVIGAGVHSDEGGAIAALDFEAQDWHAIWKASKLCADAAAETEYLSHPGNAGEDAMEVVRHQPYIGWWQRYYQVQKRYFVMHWRNVPTNLSRLILMVVLGVLLGLIYLQINRSTFQGVVSFLAVIFLGIAFPASVSAASAFPSFFRQRAVYYRESTIGMYDYWTFSLGMTIVELPYIFFALVFFVVPFYFMIGFVYSGTLFFKFLLVVYIQALVYMFLSQLWMALCPSQISSNIINGLFMSLFFMFAGVYIRPVNIRTGWKWFYYLNPLAKSLIAGALPQFYCDVDAVPHDCPQIYVVDGDGNLQPQYVYEYVVSQLNGAASTYWPMLGYLLAVRHASRHIPSMHSTPEPQHSLDAACSSPNCRPLSLSPSSSLADSVRAQDTAAAGPALRVSHQALVELNIITGLLYGTCAVLYTCSVPPGCTERARRRRRWSPSCLTRPPPAPRTTRLLLTGPHPSPSPPRPSHHRPLH